MKDKTKKYLIPGIIGGILTMIGDRLLTGKCRVGHTKACD